MPGVCTQNDRTDDLLFKVQRDADCAGVKLDQLAVAHAREAVYCRDPVTNLDDGADVDGLNRDPRSPQSDAE